MAVCSFSSTFCKNHQKFAKNRQKFAKNHKVRMEAQSGATEELWDSSAMAAELGEGSGGLNFDGFSINFDGFSPEISFVLNFVPDIDS